MANRTDRRGHRPPHVPTEASSRQVEALTSYGVPQEHVARIIGIGEKTLRKYYAEVMATAQVKANSLVAQSLFNRATKGDGQPAVTAAIFWLKTRAGWKETNVHEHNGQVTFDVSSDPIPTEDAWEAKYTDIGSLAAPVNSHRLGDEE